MTHITKVTVTQFEGLSSLEKEYPKSYSSLSEASVEIRAEEWIDWKFRFTVEASNWDTYEGNGYKEGSKGDVDLHRHMSHHLKHVADSNESYMTEEHKENAKTWMNILSNS